MLGADDLQRGQRVHLACMMSNQTRTSEPGQHEGIGQQDTKSPIACQTTYSAHVICSIIICLACHQLLSWLEMLLVSQGI